MTAVAVAELACDICEPISLIELVSSSTALEMVCTLAETCSEAADELTASWVVRSALICISLPVVEMRCEDVWRRRLASVIRRAIVPRSPKPTSNDAPMSATDIEVSRIRADRRELC